MLVFAILYSRQTVSPHRTSHSFLKLHLSHFSTFAEPPDKPVDVIITDVESRSATVLWSTPYFGNSFITTYQIDYKFADVANWDSGDQSKTHNVPGGDNMFKLRDLMPGASYEARIRAENALGWSDYSSKTKFTTAEEGRAAAASDSLNLSRVGLSETCEMTIIINSFAKRK